MDLESCKVFCLEVHTFWVIKKGSSYTDGLRSLNTESLSITLKYRFDRKPHITPVELMPFNLLQFNPND
jgi:hypothetical protein